MLSLKFRYSFPWRPNWKLAVYHSWQGWNSTIILAWSDCFYWNKSSQPWLFKKIILKHGEHLLDTNGPHPRLINHNLGVEVGKGGGQHSCSQYFLFPRWHLRHSQFGNHCTRFSLWGVSAKLFYTLGKQKHNNSSPDLFPEFALDQ